LLPPTIELSLKNHVNVNLPNYCVTISSLNAKMYN